MRHARVNRALAGPLTAGAAAQELRELDPATGECLGGPIDEETFFPGADHFPHTKIDANNPSNGDISFPDNTVMPSARPAPHRRTARRRTAPTERTHHHTMENTMTTTRTPETTLRDALDAFNARDRERLVGVLAADVTWTSPGTGPTAGSAHGPEEVWDQVFAPIWEAPMRLDLVTILSTETLVAAHIDLVFEIGESERRFSLVEVTRHRDGRIVAREAFLDRQDEFDAFTGQLVQQVDGT